MKSLIRISKLRDLSLEERALAMAEAFGIESQRLLHFSYLNQELSPGEKVIGLATEVYKGIVGRGEGEDVALAHITYDMLRLMLTEPRAGITGVGRLNLLIRRECAEELKILNNTKSARLITALRKKIAESQGSTFSLNATPAEQSWEGITFSNFDILDGVRLPTLIRADTAFLLGYLFYSAFRPERNRIDISTAGEQDQFFSSLINNIFNDNFGFYMTRGVQRERVFYHYCTSKALATWLQAIGFEKGGIKERQRINFAMLPRENVFDYEGAREAFLYGMIAKRGSLYPLATGFTLNLQVAKAAPEVTAYINALCEGLGFKTSCFEKKGQVYFCKDDCYRLVDSTLLSENGFKYEHRGAFVLPNHLSMIQEMENAGRLYEKKHKAKRRR
jgi:hypothetical protein